tara:strand:+ start:518 stop:862 length:345 start_codon:yes stop_codon:yes gene_type:complete
MMAEEEEEEVEGVEEEGEETEDRDRNFSASTRSESREFAFVFEGGSSRLSPFGLAKTLKSLVLECDIIIWFGSTLNVKELLNWRIQIKPIKKGFILSSGRRVVWSWLYVRRNVG